LRRIVAAAGHDVVEFGGVGEMLLNDTGSAPGCILLRTEMAGPSGFDLQAALAGKPDALPMIFVAGKASSTEVIRVLKQGADFLLEPLEEQAVLTSVTRAVETCIS